MKVGPNRVFPASLKLLAPGTWRETTSDTRVHSFNGFCSRLERTAKSAKSAKWPPQIKKPPSLLESPCVAFLISFLFALACAEVPGVRQISTCIRLKGCRRWSFCGPFSMQSFLAVLCLTVFHVFFVHKQTYRHTYRHTYIEKYNYNT